MNILVRIGLTACLAGVGMLLTSSFLSAEANKEGVKVGDKAPVFHGTDDQGQPWKSSDHVGKKILVVYFFPADFTGGCTAQACGFRDDLSKLAGKDIEVVGISGDSAKTHALFKKEHKLGFTLLADEDGSIAKQFGVPVGKGGTVKHKTENGTEVPLVRGVTIQRWTFVIDKQGNVAAKDTKVSAGQDSKKVLETVEKLHK